MSFLGQRLRAFINFFGADVTMRLPRRFSRVRLLGMVGVAASISCVSPDDGTPTSDSDTEASGPVWADLEGQDRLNYMAEVVMPTLAPRFAEVEGGWEALDCVSCHGPEGGDVGWAMPNGLKPLGLEAFPLPETFSSPEEEAVSRFMIDVVTPEMARLLGQPEFDPNDPLGGGFGCFGCHEVAE